ncbi:hypothetical protein AS156_06870 [Bradyrhizobium macuxiense]|uniref:Uncharacterized protein n=1 Tax=Bradyrhizobium macuxiense TaxID=1755647 RepID=A0A109JTB2_9BRAD|nr:hypothetical protein [Bradyrhizobium macuxiense]KWV54684.1 hypothetical protein AS156_06870 [Bradyrhizobium macuxiense]
MNDPSWKIVVVDRIVEICDLLARRLNRRGFASSAQAQGSVRELSLISQGKGRSKGCFGVPSYESWRRNMLLFAQLSE